MRHLLGALAIDAPRTSLRLPRRGDWVRIVNRGQNVDVRQSPLSLQCLEPQTSSLHVCDVYPYFGKAILRAALRDWSFALAQEVRFSDAPTLSFIIPHRGTERERHLHLVIRSIAGLPVPVECIVVEQDNVARLSGLPGNTRYLHLPDPSGSADWNKCLALNAGASIARGRTLVFHDGDILVPERYGQALVRLFDSQRIAVAFPQRFLFYLKQRFTEDLLANPDPAALYRATPEQVRQNWVGGTLAIRREAFEDIGEYDTSLTGWTGEDREFHDRCQLLPGWFHGFIPFIHLWHAPQADKLDASTRARNNAHIAGLLAEPRETRATRLRAEGRQ